MAKTAWPTTTELTNRLTGLGITTLPTGLALQDEIDAAVEMLEQESGQRPFKEESAAGTFELDPERRTFLDLRSRWTDIDSVEIDGDAVTAGEDYWAYPVDGPYMWLEFTRASVMTGLPQTIAVEGKRGYAVNIPLTVWLAVLDYAAGSIYKTAAAVGTVSAGAISEIQQDSVRLKYAGASTAAGQDTASKLMDSAVETFRRYKRPQIGGL